MAKASIDALLDSLEWKPIEPTHDTSQSGLPYAAYEAVLELGSHKLRCYVLSDGQRVFDADDVMKFFSGE